MDDSRRYQYHPLPQGHFRLMKLLPGTGEDSIQINIESCELSIAPPFTALSYCWQNGSQAFRCDCNGSQSVFVTQNLDQALRRCRNEKEEVHLWVDQICIDQDSDTDKAQQVGLMRAVYSSATNVVIWLGTADEKTRLVYELVDQIGQEINHKIRTNPRTNSYNPNDRTEFDIPLTISSSDEPEWLAFRRFLSRPWFERTWTFQELVLAKQAYLWCGQYKTSWNQFFLVCRAVDAWDRNHRDAASHLKGETEHMNFMGTCAMHRLMKGKRPDFETATKSWTELGSLMKYAMSLKASLGHDKIYGLLGVAEDVDVDQIPIQYQAPLREVYAHVTKYLIAQRGDLAPISLKSVTPEMIPRIGPVSLPSWVPDYRYDRSEFENPRMFAGPKPLARGRERLYNATGSSRANIVVDNDLHLHLQGVLIGRIKFISELSGNKSGLESIGKNVLTDGSWQQFAQKHLSGSEYTFTNEPISLAYARTRVCDYMPGESRPQHRLARGQAPSIVPEPGLSSLIVTPNGERLLSAEPGDVIPGRILASTTGQRLCVSDEGHLCLCHQNCTPGDQIWLVMGADMPYVLRKLETGNYHFMGEAYVHGIMDGEHLVQRYKHTTQAGANLNNVAWLDSLRDGIKFPTQKIVLI